MRERSTWLRALLTLLALVSTLVQRAVQAAETGDRQPSVLLLDVSAPSELGRARLETLRIHLSDVTAELIVEQAGDATTTQRRVQKAVARGRALRAAAVLFVEDLAGAELRVYWVEPRHGKVWMRNVAIGRDGFEADSETAALIARGGVEELLEAGRLSSAPVVSLDVEKPATRAPAPSPTKPAPVPHKLGIGVGYVGTSFAKEASWQSGLQLSVSARLWRQLYARGGYAFMPALSFEHATGAARLTRRPFELALGYRAPRALALRAEAGLFVDRVERTTTEVASGQLPTSSTARYLTGGALKLGLDLQPLARARLFGLFGVQVPFNHFDYLASDSAASDVAIHVRAIRPLVELGAIVEIW